MTPRSGVPAQRPPWEARRKDWSDVGRLNGCLNDIYSTGGYASVEGVPSRPRLPAEPMATSSHSRDPTPRDMAPSLTPGTFCGGTVGYSGGGTGGSSSRHALKAKPSLTGNQDSSSPALSPSSQALGVGVTGQSGRSIPVMPSAGPQYRDAEMQSEKWSTDFGRIVGSPKGGARVASFVRLNGFLLRTHITSLLSALAEDGWLEAWEKERLCSSARDAESRWAQSFLQIYMRFVETDDVATFVAGLKAQVS